MLWLVAARLGEPQFEARDQLQRARDNKANQTDERRPSVTPPGASSVHHRPHRALLLSAMADYHQYDGPPRPRPKRVFLSRPVSQLEIKS